MSESYFCGEQVAEFATACHESPKLWDFLFNQKIIHRDFGVGRVVELRHRVDAMPLIDVKFGEKLSKTFNEVAFLHGLISHISLPEDGVSQFESWRLQFVLAKILVDAKFLIRQRVFGVSDVPDVLGADDLLLCLQWSNIYPLPDRSASGSSILKYFVHCAGPVVASRLISARRAELLVKKYYLGLGRSVVDVSILQLGDKTDDWRDFDFDVGYPIDVKNTRSTINGGMHYAEHTVAKFKTYRKTSEDVRIVGVRSPYFSRPFKANQEGDETASIVLGETSVRTLAHLVSWLSNRFGSLFEWAGVSSRGRLAGWLFEYPDDHYIGRAEAGVKLVDYFRRVGGVRDKPALYLVAAAYGADINLASDQLLSDLARLFASCGISKRALILYSMGIFLETAVKGDCAIALSRRLREVTTLWQGFAGSNLGLDDPLDYVSRFFSAFEVIGENIGLVSSRVRCFRLKSSEILDVVYTDGSSQVLLAYCGGFIRGAGRCGHAPLVIGQNDVCPSCSRLVCDKCGFCGQSCPICLKRVESLCLKNDSDRWKGYRDRCDDQDDSLDDDEEYAYQEDDCFGSSVEILSQRTQHAGPSLADDSYWSAVVREIDLGIEGVG